MSEPVGTVYLAVGVARRSNSRAFILLNGNGVGRDSTAATAATAAGGANSVMCVYSGRHISRLESIQSYLSAAIGLGEPTVEVVTRLGSVRQSGDLAQAYNIGFSVVSSNYARRLR